MAIYTALRLPKWATILVVITILNTSQSRINKVGYAICILPMENKI